MASNRTMPSVKTAIASAKAMSSIEAAMASMETMSSVETTVVTVTKPKAEDIRRVVNGRDVDNLGFRNRLRVSNDTT